MGDPQLQLSVPVDIGQAPVARRHHVRTRIDHPERLPRQAHRAPYPVVGAGQLFARAVAVQIGQNDRTVGGPHPLSENGGRRERILRPTSGLALQRDTEIQAHHQDIVDPVPVDIGDAGKAGRPQTVVDVEARVLAVVVPQHAPIPSVQSPALVR